jgi:hypothetical protein
VEYFNVSIGEIFIRERNYYIGERTHQGVVIKLRNCCAG